MKENGAYTESFRACSLSKQLLQRSGAEDDAHDINPTG
jgi:hypothetical protein